MKEKATFEAVARVCEKLESQGFKVTGDLVLSHTGGSKGSVLGHIKAWRESNKQSPLAVSTVPDYVLDAVMRSLASASAAVTSQLHELIEASNRGENDALESLKSAEKRADEFVSLLEAERGIRQQEVAQADKFQATLTQEIDILNRQVAELKIERAQLIDSGEAARTSAAKAEFLIDRADTAAAKAEQQVDALTAKLELEIAARVVAEKVAAVADKAAEQIQRIPELEKKIEALHATLEARQAELRAQDKALLELNAEVFRLRDMVAELESQKAVLVLHKDQ